MDSVMGPILGQTLISDASLSSCLASQNNEDNVEREQIFKKT